MSKEAFESISVNNIESRERSTGLHFLIVEDNQRNIKAAQRYLNKRGDELTKISVDFVRGYDEAEQRLETGQYNGVITDLFFPLIIPHCSMFPKLFKLLKRGHENASPGTRANPLLASICA